MPTEPTVMISGDVMELHHLIYAEREAHAAEVASLRGNLDKLACEAKAIEAGYLPDDLTRAIDDAESALATPPTAAAQAVEGMRVALEPFKRFADRLDSPPNWVPDGCPINTDSGGVSDFSVAQVRQARAALARWKEATRG